MRCLASSFGSAGDFLPTLAVAAALRRRGHDVRFVANPAYAARVAAAGLDLIPAGAAVDVGAKIEQNPSYGDFSGAARMLEDLVAPHIEATYRVVGDLIRSATFDVVVANDVGHGALWVAAEAQVPSVLVHPSPMIWMSWRDPVVIGRPFPTLLLRPLTVAMRGLLDWYMTRFLRGVARRIDTPLPDVSFRGSERMAAIRLGLWSSLLRGSTPSDPPNGTICGYARASGLECATLSPEVDAFLASDRAPIVVGFGSVYARRATPSLLALAQACSDVGRRCLVIGHAAGVEFPSNTLAVRSAPYDRIFPRAAAVVVHAGSGTIGEALRAGRPIIGVPFAYDQFSLCARAERLGVAVRVPVGRRTRADFIAVIERVLSDGAMAHSAAEAGARFNAERDGAETAADVIERTVAASPKLRSPLSVDRTSGASGGRTRDAPTSSGPRPPGV